MREGKKSNNNKQNNNKKQANDDGDDDDDRGSFSTEEMDDQDDDTENSTSTYLTALEQMDDAFSVENTYALDDDVDDDTLKFDMDDANPFGDAQNVNATATSYATTNNY